MSETTKPCPECDEAVVSAALSCPHCRHEFQFGRRDYNIFGPNIYAAAALFVAIFVALLLIAQD